MNLRAAVLAAGGVAAIAGAGLLLAGAGGPGIPLLVGGGVLTLGTVLESWRYRKTPPAGAHWQPTGERFEDPATGRPMEVLYDPVSGERRYVPSDERPGRD